MSYIDIFERKSKFYDLVANNDLKGVLEFIEPYIREDGAIQLASYDELLGGGSDALVDFINCPTYEVTLMLIKNNFFEKRLLLTIEWSLSRCFCSNGYENDLTQIGYLKKLYEYNALDYFERYSIRSNLSVMVNNYRTQLLTDNTNCNNFCSDISYKSQIIELLKVVDKNVIFTYGTLMKGNSNHLFIKDNEYLGDSILNNFCLLEINHFPGAVYKKNYKVYGELYKVTDKEKENIDKLEGSLYTFQKELFYTDNSVYYAGYYEYSGKLNSNIRLPYGKWTNKRMDIFNYVWYASYGSNILNERFNKYINQTKSKNIPIDSKPVTMNGKVYFAKNSRRWNNGGVAFFEPNDKDISYGWMYLIDNSQLNEIHKLEGKSYYHDLLEIGQDKYGIKIVAVNGNWTNEICKPSKEYLEVIGCGLKQRYGFDDSFIEEYLESYEKLDLNTEHVISVLEDQERK